MITEEDLEGFGGGRGGGGMSMEDELRASLNISGDEAFRRRAAMSGRNADREIQARDRSSGGAGGPGGAPRERRSYDDEPFPPLHSIHRGTVKQIKPFGALVKMDGYRKFGLVHISQ